MRLLDLCCCEGGAAYGYSLAGFSDITGIDFIYQKKYPFNFIQDDAIDFLTKFGANFDFIHASPPCQLWASGYNPNRDQYPDLITPLRDILTNLDKPYIIENVIKAPLKIPIMICGGGLGIKYENMQLHRHRIFESNLNLVGMPCKKIADITATITGSGTPTGTLQKLGRGLKIGEKRALMGMPWASVKGLAEAVPPAYTLYLGKQVLVQI